MSGGAQSPCCSTYEGTLGDPCPKCSERFAASERAPRSSTRDTALQSAQEEIARLRDVIERMKLQKSYGAYEMVSAHANAMEAERDTALAELATLRVAYSTEIKGADESINALGRELSAERQKREEAEQHIVLTADAAPRLLRMQVALDAEKAAHEATKRLHGEARTHLRTTDDAYNEAQTERDEARRERDAKAADAETYRLGLIDWRFRAERAESERDALAERFEAEARRLEHVATLAKERGDRAESERDALKLKLRHADECLARLATDRDQCRAALSDAQSDRDRRIAAERQADALQADAGSLKEQVKALRVVLLSVEWSADKPYDGSTRPACPICHNYDGRRPLSVNPAGMGHKPDCALARALVSSEGETL